MSNEHRDHIERRYNSLINALSDVIYYNTNDDFLDNFICQLKVYGENFHPSIDPPKERNPVVFVLWQIIVCMYGSYSVSPRGGWIDDLSAALCFLEELKGGEKNGLSDANNSEDQ